VGRQVVHDDDVAGLKRWRQHLLDPGEEGRTIHRTVQDHRRGDTREPQPADERRRLPVSMRHCRDTSGAASRAAAAARHLGRGASLIDEDET
jgi:hypothetical protein